MTNPFEVRTPENLSPREMAALFENVFADMPSVDQSGHTFIHGPRGSGKSMMFRYLLPEVQKEAALMQGRSYSLQDLNQYAVHFPIKSSSIQSIDFGPSDMARSVTLGNHYLSMKASQLVLNSLSKFQENFDIEKYDEHIGNFRRHFEELSADYGVATDLTSQERDQLPLAQMQRVVDREVRAVESYLRRNMALDQDRRPYDLGVTTFIDYVVPLLRELQKFTAKYFFLMIDDADDLDVGLQKIVNTWVSHRTTEVVSLKISTQLRYATYQTLSGSIVESPHDFNSVDLTQIYTSRVDHYFDRVIKIVDRRFKFYEFTQSPEKFFPADPKQEREIEERKRAIREKHEAGEKVSSRRHDDVYRYALANYMVHLHKNKKSNTFSYSGFKTLVNLSSGIIRLFLDPADKMYSKCESSRTDADAPITSIPPKIQNSVNREWSEKFYTEELPRIDANLEDVEKLKNLIKGLGRLFTEKLLDEAATERRVFSVFMNEPPEDVRRIIDLGVSHGYFQKSSIRSKERTGRKLEVIFNRRLAPYFYLDPTGYSGRLSVTIDHLRLAMVDPERFVKARLALSEIEVAVSQNSLFE